MSLAALQRAAMLDNVSFKDQAVGAHRPPLRSGQPSDDHSPNGEALVRGTHPYREAPEPAHRAGRGEEAVLYGLLVVVGLIPVLVALATGAKFGGEPTIGMMMVGAGLWGLWGLRPRRHDDRVGL